MIEKWLCDFFSLAIEEIWTMLGSIVLWVNLYLYHAYVFMPSNILVNCHGNNYF